MQQKTILHPQVMDSSAAPDKSSKPMPLYGAD